METRRDYECTMYICYHNLHKGASRHALPDACLQHCMASHEQISQNTAQP